MGLSPLKHQNAVLHLRKPQNYSTPQHFDCVFGKPDSEPPEFSLKCLTNMVTFPMPSLRMNVLPFPCVQGMPGDKTETGKVNYQLSAVCYYFLSLSLLILTSLLFGIYRFEQKMAFSFFFLQHCSFPSCYLWQLQAPEVSLALGILSPQVQDAACLPQDQSAVRQHSSTDAIPEVW